MSTDSDARAGIRRARQRLVDRRLQLLDDAGAQARSGNMAGEQALLEQVDELNRQISSLDAALGHGAGAAARSVR